MTVQLGMPAEAMQLVRGAFDAAETEEQAPLPYGEVGATSATDEEDATARLKPRLEALSVQEAAYAGVIDAFLMRTSVPTEADAGEKIVYRYRYAPAVALNATWEECLAFAADPNVVAIHPEVQFEAANERSAAGARTIATWASGYDGTGAVIAVVEDAQMDTTNGRDITIISATMTTGTPLRTSRSASRNSRSISSTNVRMTMARKNGGMNCFSV